MSVILSRNTIMMVLAVRGLMRQDEVYNERTTKTMHKLRLTIEETLEEPKMRKNVLRFITGLPIVTQNNLTQHTHSVLIDMFKDGQHDMELRQVEQYLFVRYTTLRKEGEIVDRKKLAKGHALLREEKIFDEEILPNLSHLFAEADRSEQYRHARGPDNTRNGPRAKPRADLQPVQLRFETPRVSEQLGQP